jgi:hypothetical protein
MRYYLHRVDRGMETLISQANTIEKAMTSRRSPRSPGSQRANRATQLQTQAAKYLGRDYLALAVISGATKAGVHVDRKKELNRDYCNELDYE